MQNKFIYTTEVDAYLELLKLGFEDLGTVDNNSQCTFVVANSDKLQIPDEYKNVCRLSNRLYL